MCPPLFQLLLQSNKPPQGCLANQSRYGPWMVILDLPICIDRKTSLTPSRASYGDPVASPLNSSQRYWLLQEYHPEEQQLLSPVLTVSSPRQLPAPSTSAQLSDIYPEGTPEGVHRRTVLCWQQRSYITLPRNLLKVPNNCIRKDNPWNTPGATPWLSPRQPLTLPCSGTQVQEPGLREQLQNP